MADIARIIEVIEPEVKALGFDLVRVKLMTSEAGDGDPALQIMAEDPATGQLVVGQCAALSRRVSEQIDMLEEQGEVLVEGTYHLEVSSPGIDRPLTRLADFVTWAGHEAKVTLAKATLAEAINDLRNFRGDITGVDGDIITVEDRRSGPVSFPFDAIHSAKLVLTDRLIAATRPLDTSGADEILEEEEG